MRWLVIVNPAAGMLRRQPAEAVAARLGASLGVPVHCTSGPGKAEALAANAGSYDGLLAIGGDGTIAEVVNGMDRDRQVLGIVAGGTGNGLARDLALPRARADADGLVLAARAVLATGARQGIDLMELQFRAKGDSRRRLAVSTSAVGYAADVVALARGRLGPVSRRLPAALCYPLGATLQAVRQPTYVVQWQLDGQPAAWHRATNVMVQNTRHAGNFHAFPRADIADGRLDTLLADATAWAQLRHNAAVLTRRHDFATAESVPACHATLASEAPLRLMIDGELVEDVTHVAWTIIPLGVRVAVPEPGPA